MYLVWMKIYLLLIIYANRCIDFKFAYTQKQSIKNCFKYENIKLNNDNRKTLSM